MNGLTPNCLDDFLLSNPAERTTLELILSRQLPFPFAGKSGILLYGTWGTGKTTLANLLPGLIETAHSKTWNLAQGVGQMPAQPNNQVFEFLFNCGGGLSSVDISKTINGANNIYPIRHFSGHDYFIFDEVDKLTLGAQQSLKTLMGLKRSMFIFTTNYLPKVDLGVVNRCHLVEMNQVNTPAAYLPIGQSLLMNMGLSATALNSNVLQSHAVNAKGSMRDFINDVVLDAIKIGGVIPA